MERSDRQTCYLSESTLDSVCAPSRLRGDGASALTACAWLLMRVRTDAALHALIAMAGAGSTQTQQRGWRHCCCVVKPATAVASGGATLAGARRGPGRRARSAQPGSRMAHGFIHHARDPACRAWFLRSHASALDPGTGRVLPRSRAVAGEADRHAGRGVLIASRRHRGIADAMYSAWQRLRGGRGGRSGCARGDARWCLRAAALDRHGGQGGWRFAFSAEHAAATESDLRAANVRLALEHALRREGGAVIARAARASHCNIAVTESPGSSSPD